MGERTWKIIISSNYISVGTNKPDTFEREFSVEKEMQMADTSIAFSRVNYSRFADKILTKNAWDDGYYYLVLSPANQEEEKPFKAYAGIYNSSEQMINEYTFNAKETKKIFDNLLYYATKKSPDKKEAYEQIHQKIMARIDGE